MDYNKITDKRVWVNVTQPEIITSPASIKRADDNASYLIKELDGMIEALKEYRVRLAKRYGDLETMSYKRALHLERRARYKMPVEYIITITRIFQDGSKREEHRENYAGKERHTALARFEELKKEFPGIEATKNLKKRFWEK